VLDKQTALAFDIAVLLTAIASIIAFRRDRTGLALGLSIMSVTFSLFMFIGNAVAGALACADDWHH
jgi:hypothetical protein